MTIKKNRISFKIKDKPRTVTEQYNRLKEKNPAIELLKNTFDLDIKY